MAFSVAWRILTYQKGRTALAVGGIFVAILLIFVELGFFIAVPQGGLLIYDHMRFDLLVTSNRYVYQIRIRHIRARPPRPRCAPTRTWRRPARSISATPSGRTRRAASGSTPR